MSSSADVIVININYRLGNLGWLAHPGFAQDDPTFPYTGNYGYLDQRMALLWIQKNIHLFGGDPKSVTIMGESGGATSVCFHYISPLSKGLFSQAVIESGCISTTTTIPLPAAGQYAVNFANKLNCHGDMTQVVACMRAVSSEQILKQSTNPVANWAVVNGHSFVEEPFVSIINNRLNYVPTIAGNCLNEGSIIVPGGPFTQDRYIAAVNAQFPEIATQVLDLYPCEAYNASDCWYAYSALIGDWELFCPTLIMGDAIAPFVKTYSYVFSHISLWGNTSFPGKGSFHSSELPFVFSTLSIYPHTDQEVTLGHMVTQYWTNFAKTQDPNGENSAAQWPQYLKEAQYPRVAIDYQVEVWHNYREKECAFWYIVF